MTELAVGANPQPPEPLEAEVNPSCFFDLFYDGLFHPVALYRRLAGTRVAHDRTLFYGLVWVLLVSASVPVVQVIWKAEGLEGLGWSVPFHAVSGLLVWLLMAVAVGTQAYAFGGQARFKTLLTLSAFSTLPWVLMGPLSLLKTGLEGPGPGIGILGGLVIWLWSVFLYALAVGATYRIFSLERVLLILLLPFVFSGVALVWVAGFFVNISHLLP